MRFGYALLGLVACTSIQCSRAVCSNGVPGIQNDNICCENQCGRCGGSGCSQLPGGEDSCCTSNIEDNGILCSDTSEAPCIIDACSNGILGVQSDNICCEGQCVTCGGVGCSGRPGGEDSCCTSNIEDNGILCSDTSEAPCIIDACSNGILGVQSDNICCEGQCVTCGGVGCSDRPGGEDACCTSNIEDNGDACDTTMEAPCIINVCSNGVPGVQDDDICCEAQCGTCGGPGCSGRPGGEDSCCTSNIEDNGILCSDTSEAPCIIDACSNGILGVQSDNICCEGQCVTCGGVGCSGRPGGEDACCTSNIEDNGDACDTTMEAPCIINVCSNGVPGVQDDDICCEAQCGTCGGPGCSGRPGGEDSCCTSNIEDNGILCSDTSQAPCIIDACSNGILGVQSDNICCEGQCVTCGGVGCSGRPGGEDACCTSNIEDNGNACDTTMEAPCIINVCSNGVPGVQDNDICCEAQCGTCGGPGCSGRPGGKDSCCTRNIKDNGILCSDTSEAPCIIDAVCSNGVPGIQNDNICCENQCGRCGGPGCSKLPGGEDSCCTRNIKDNGILCSDTSEAPCIIDAVCSNGVPGIQKDNICCENQCGRCGGPGCSKLSGGEDSCCTRNIKDNGIWCSDTSEAPCIIDAVCSNGVLGIQNDNICCENQCGRCGGPGCSKLPGGEDSCCTRNIKDNGILCSDTSEAPCIIDAVCSNGVPGIQNDNICCEKQCGRCGGPGCSKLPGGEDSCCTSNIDDNGILCSDTSEAPCIIDACSNGILGVQSDNICCEGQCVTCGGVGCSGRPGGEDACCTSNIEDNGDACDTTMKAPCIINVCSNGMPGVQDDDICCEAQCGTCGGVGCSGLPGGEDACCTSNIRDGGAMCDTTMQAPCIIDRQIKES